MVTPQDVVDKAMSFVGQPNSDGSDGNHPLHHPWAFWCEAFVEMVHEQLGLTRVRRDSALAHAQALNLSGGPAPAGAMVFFGTAFFPEDGHVAISLGDGTCVGTVTDGTGVGIRALKAGWPTGREPQGHGGAVVVVGVTPDQGAWESHAQGEGHQADGRGAGREARCRAPTCATTRPPESRVP